VTTGPSPRDLLGLPRGFAPDDLRRAYRRAALHTHPDRGGDPALFRAVTRAYEQLSENEEHGPDETARATKGLLADPGSRPSRGLSGFDRFAAGCDGWVRDLLRVAAVLAVLGALLEVGSGLPGLAAGAVFAALPVLTLCAILDAVARSARLIGLSTEAAGPARRLR
jgi:hypothetical protein